MKPPSLPILSGCNEDHPRLRLPGLSSHRTPFRQRGGGGITDGSVQAFVPAFLAQLRDCHCPNGVSRERYVKSKSPRNRRDAAGKAAALSTLSLPLLGVLPPGALIRRNPLPSAAMNRRASLRLKTWPRYLLALQTAGGRCDHHREAVGNQCGFALQNPLPVGGWHSGPMPRRGSTIQGRRHRRDEHRHDRAAE